jgi:diguanylate cyclase (GGDEF)-like protein
MNHYQNNPKPVDILIVDDTPDNLRLLSAMLTNEGYHVRKALDGHMALTAVNTLQPDIILLDIMMPGLDGYQVCQQLKTNVETTDIPIIFLSALDDVFDKVKAFRVGGADYITKPFHFEEVLVRVNHQLSLRSAVKQIRQLNTYLESRVQERTQQLEEAHQQMLKLALCDPLTGLANRVSLIERLEQSLTKAAVDDKYQFAVLFLDCDRFKIVNDSLGHEVGDELLIAIARRLQQLLKSTDLLARLGGDEFAILLDNVRDAQCATRLADRILQGIAQPFNLQEQVVFINASIGIALSASGYSKPEHLLRDADAAMYHAKSAGKARYRMFESAMHTKALQRLQLEMDLRRAIANQEFILHYQPIVALKTGKVDGVEALVRWIQPNRGFISPAEFIPIAEETGLIHELGCLVLRQACQQLYDWQKHGLVTSSFSISVNLSACQFAQADLTEQIFQILAECCLSPHCLKLEITESAIMDNPELAADILKELRQQHIQLSMDDFGTGYSSLSYLRSFPMDNLKIDRSFVQSQHETAKDLGLVPVIIAIAQTMNMQVVAEGIETPEQLNHLRDLNCDFGQGYLFSKPLPAEKIIDIITSSSQW